MENCNVSLTAADKGFKVCCSYMEKPANASRYDNMSYRSKEFAFGEGELNKAMAKFKELVGVIRNDSSEEEGETSPDNEKYEE